MNSFGSVGGHSPGYSPGGHNNCFFKACSFFTRWLRGLARKTTTVSPRFSLRPLRDYTPRGFKSVTIPKENLVYIRSGHSVLYLVSVVCAWRGMSISEPAKGRCLTCHGTDDSFKHCSQPYIYTALTYTRCTVLISISPELDYAIK